MKREDLSELHYITHQNNVPSICRLGILSHNNAKKVRHDDIADEEIQARRRKRLPNGNLLHDCLNLYFCARNPMLYRGRIQRENLCVLRVSTDVLDIEGVVISDRNASSDYVAFYPAPEGIERIKAEYVFAERWDVDDQIEYYKRKSLKCAEVLVPDRVEPGLIFGVYVSGGSVLRRFNALGTGLAVQVNSDLFFL